MTSPGYDDWYADRWLEGFAEWDEVEEQLRAEWDQIDDMRTGLVLKRAGGLVAIDSEGRWRARHRRALHRLGFRRVDTQRGDLWSWDVDPQLEDVDLERFAEPFDTVLPLIRPPEVAEAQVRSLRRYRAEEHLVAEQTMRVLRDVFGCAPHALAVHQPDDDRDSW